MNRIIRPSLILLALVTLTLGPPAALAEEGQPAEGAKNAEASGTQSAASDLGCCCVKQNGWRCNPTKLMKKSVCKKAADAYKVEHKWTAGECAKD